jgi:hypothetical protein
MFKRISQMFSESMQEDVLCKTDALDALNVQIGGNHYKECAIQPVEYIESNNLGFLEGCIVKRITRHDKKTGKGAQDIDKMIHELQLIKKFKYGC